MAKVGFTGTREGMTSQQRITLTMLIREFKPVAFLHGDCIGADEQAHKIARYENVPVVAVFPPNKDVLRAFCQGDIMKDPADYLVRNMNIVNDSTVVIAAPKSMEEQKGGTWQTVNFAKVAKKELYIIQPDGTYLVQRSWNYV